MQNITHQEYGDRRDGLLPWLRGIIHERFLDAQEFGVGRAAARTSRRKRVHPSALPGKSMGKVR